MCLLEQSQIQDSPGVGGGGGDRGAFTSKMGSSVFLQLRVLYKSNGHYIHTVTEYLPPAYVVRREVMFLLCPPFVGGGVPDPALDGGGYPIQPWTGGVSRCSLGWGGYPQSWMEGYPISRGVPHLLGGTPTLDRGYSISGGYPISGFPPV